MDARLLKLLAGPRKRALPDGGEMTVLSAQALLEAKQEAGGGGLRLTACILARSLSLGGERLFASGDEVLRSLSAERIESLSALYLDMAAGQDGQDAETLLPLLGGEETERLKWRVLRAFGVLPCEERARRMTAADYVLCAMHLVLDEEEELARLCPACREQARQTRCPGCGAPMETVNAGFDEKRYEELKHGSVCNGAS